MCLIGAKGARGVGGGEFAAWCVRLKCGCAKVIFIENIETIYIH